MKVRTSISVSRHKISVMSLLLLFPLLTSCTNPVKEPFKNLTGHWISEDSQRHFYFSEKRKLVITDNNKETLFDVEYNIGVVEDTMGNKKKKKIWLSFHNEIFENDECWFTFSEDKRRIISSSFGILNFVDREQEP